ncbi:MAG TPA: hypothetical protein VEB41_00930 [Burkholderiales bacterium]|nr:hypothetical protein [Burkholderiales bacterium]
MKTLVPALVLSAALAAGCASFDGRDLEPGKARLADVEASMGKPTERVARPDGGTDLYYSRLPFGRTMYVASLDRDGVLRSLDQRLTLANIQKIVPDTTTAKQVRELLGPPFRIERMPRQGYNSWEYPWQISEDRRILWVNVSDDGIVRQVIQMHDYETDPPSGPAKD